MILKKSANSLKDSFFVRNDGFIHFCSLTYEPEIIISPIISHTSLNAFKNCELLTK